MTRHFASLPRALRGAFALRALAIVFTIVVSGDARAHPRFENPTLYLSGDTLLVDLQVDSLFSARARDAIASGMTTSIVYQFRLQSSPRARPVRRSISLRLDHDIWEGRYQVVRLASPPDTLVTTDFDEVLRYCSDITGLAIGAITAGTQTMVLSVRAVVDPISPEQEAKTRRWLNLLERGSVLELFFSLEPKDDGSPWFEIARFRKRDLPSEVPPRETPDPPEAPTPTQTEAAP